MTWRDSILAAGQRYFDWGFDGTPEQTYSGLVERRDRWRHPEQLLEEEVEPGWRKAKAE